MSDTEDKPLWSDCPVEYLDRCPGDGMEESSELWNYNGPGWYFWDETWTVLHGPFNTQRETIEALAEYAENL